NNWVKLNGGEATNGGVNGGTELIGSGASEAGKDHEGFGNELNGSGVDDDDCEGCYTNEDDSSCDERYFNGYSNFYTDDHMDYGYSDANGSQGVEDKVVGFGGSLGAYCGAAGAT
ncbi:hypothetical protein ACH5RR_001252, partial [Cinchona calisaya]